MTGAERLFAITLLTNHFFKARSQYSRVAGLRGLCSFTGNRSIGMRNISDYNGERPAIVSSMNFLPEGCICG
jgi:hypothetical protein